MTALIWLLVRQHRTVKYFYTYISLYDWCMNPFYVGYVLFSRVGERAVPFLEGFFYSKMLRACCRNWDIGSSSQKGHRWDPAFCSTHSRVTDLWVPTQPLCRQVSLWRWSHSSKDWGQTAWWYLSALSSCLPMDPAISGVIWEEYKANCVMFPSVHFFSSHVDVTR